MVDRIELQSYELSFEKVREWFEEFQKT